MSVKIELEIGNDAIRATRREIRKFLAFETEGMAGDRSDRRDEAAVGYVVLRRLLELITREVDRQDREQSRPPARPHTVREERR